MPTKADITVPKGLRQYLRMKFRVFVIITKNKIVNSIIMSNTINMMNVFISCKFSTKMFFHNIAMFINLFSVNLKTFVSIFFSEPTTLPMGGKFTKQSFLGFRKIFPMYLGKFIFSWFSNNILMATFQRAKLSLSRVKRTSFYRKYKTAFVAFTFNNRWVIFNHNNF